MRIAGVRLFPCSNNACKWSDSERFIPISRLIVDRRGSVYMLPTFVCECSHQLRTEVILA